MVYYLNSGLKCLVILQSNASHLQSEHYVIFRGRLCSLFWWWSVNIKILFKSGQSDSCPNCSFDYRNNSNFAADWSCNFIKIIKHCLDRDRAQISVEYGTLRLKVAQPTMQLLMEVNLRTLLLNFNNQHRNRGFCQNGLCHAS